MAPDRDSLQEENDLPGALPQMRDVSGRKDIHPETAGFEPGTRSSQQEKKPVPGELAGRRSVAGGLQLLALVRKACRVVQLWGKRK